MSTVTDIDIDHLTAAPPDYLRDGRGWKSWFLTLDHKRIALLYLLSTSIALVLGGLFAMALRVELFSPGETIMDADQYNHAFTLHGAIMIFLFIIPAIPAVLGNFLVPLMLGAKDVAFPRLNLTSWYLYVIGAVVFLAAILNGGLDTGWTFYAPYSTETSSGVVLAVTGTFVLGFSSILTGLNIIVTVAKMRPAGMTWMRLPLFLWSVFATGIIQVLATPVLGITLVLLVAERLLGVGIFDPAQGGDPVLFQHFFWFYSHPAVYIMILPAMGIISELMAVFSRKRIFGYKFIAWSSIAIAVLGFLVWGHHMFVSGQSRLATVIFSAITFSVSIPSGIKIFNWLATMYRGSIRLDTPMLYALSFIFLFAIGGLTGLFLGALATDVHLHDTYFVVAHFHYVMMGGTLVAYIGGLFYWWPKMFGRMYSELWGRIGCLLIVIGFNLTFFPQFLLGTRGMPRRYWDYAQEYTGLHRVSTVGAMLLGVGLAVAAGVLIHSIRRGRKAAPNPWGAATLEWQTSSPPPKENFETSPPATDPYDYEGLRRPGEVKGGTA